MSSTTPLGSKRPASDADLSNEPGSKKPRLTADTSMPPNNGQEVGEVEDSLTSDEEFDGTDEGTLFRRIRQGHGGVYEILPEDDIQYIGTLGLHTCLAVYFEVDATHCFFAHINFDITDNDTNEFREFSKDYDGSHGLINGRTFDAVVFKTTEMLNNARTAAQEKGWWAGITDNTIPVTMMNSLRMASWIFGIQNKTHVADAVAHAVRQWLGIPLSQYAQYPVQKSKRVIIKHPIRTLKDDLIWLKSNKRGRGANARQQWKDAPEPKVGTPWNFGTGDVRDNGTINGNDGDFRPEGTDTDDSSGNDGDDGQDDEDGQDRQNGQNGDEDEDGEHGEDDKNSDEQPTEMSEDWDRDEGTPYRRIKQGHGEVYELKITDPIGFLGTNNVNTCLAIYFVIDEAHCLFAHANMEISNNSGDRMSEDGDDLRCYRVNDASYRAVRIKTKQMLDRARTNAQAKGWWPQGKTITDAMRNSLRMVSRVYDMGPTQGTFVADAVAHGVREWLKIPEERKDDYPVVKDCSNVIIGLPLEDPASFRCVRNNIDSQGKQIWRPVEENEYGQALFGTRSIQTDGKYSPAGGIPAYELVSDSEDGGEE